MMKEAFRETSQHPFKAVEGEVTAVTRAELARCRHWSDAFSNQRKDRRYYELVEDTIHQGFDYRYFIIRDAAGEIGAVQPFFVLDQDLLGGIAPGNPARMAAEFIRLVWPRFMRMRTLMVGCAAGEGHLDGADELSWQRSAGLLAGAIETHARDAKASLIVLKEFPAQYRRSMEMLVDGGYARVPSLPMVYLDLEYRDFEDYMRRALSTRMRAQLRRKFRDAEQAAPIKMSVINDVTPIIDDIYPLYLQIYGRSPLRFEMLTKDYLCRIGRLMPDKVRFFVWRQSGKVVAFSMTMVHDDTIYNEYLGLDYAVALDLHLYFYAFRDIMSWAMANGYKRLVSGGVSYDPKWHLRFRLHPLDLYVRHTSRIANAILKRLLPFLEPTRHDKTLRRFPNYTELWDSGSPVQALDPLRSQREKKRVA